VLLRFAGDLTHAEVGAAMGRGLASGGPYLIDVRIDPTFK